MTLLGFSVPTDMVDDFRRSLATNSEVVEAPITPKGAKNISVIARSLEVFRVDANKGTATAAASIRKKGSDKARNFSGNFCLVRPVTTAISPTVMRNCADSWMALY